MLKPNIFIALCSLWTRLVCFMTVISSFSMFCFFLFVFQVLHAEECQVGAWGDIRPHRKVSGTPSPSQKKKISMLHLLTSWGLSFSGGCSLEIIILFSSCLCLSCQPPLCCFPSCRYNSLHLFPPHSQSGGSLADLKLHISLINCGCRTAQRGTSLALRHTHTQINMDVIYKVLVISLNHQGGGFSSLFPPACRGE